MKTQQQENAAHLVNVLATYEQNFDMNAWFEPGSAFSFGDMVSIDKQDDVLSCGTTMCAAGWGAFLAGHTILVGEDAVLTKTGETMPIEEAGARWLDLDPQHGHQLFYSNAEVAMAVLRRMASGERYTQALIDEEYEKLENEDA